MARPRADSKGPSARERIQREFWRTLEEGRFDVMTIGALCKAANVNHNTFYYHFSCIEDLAEKCFDENLLPELHASLLRELRSDELSSGNLAAAGAFMADSDVMLHFNRACLFATADAPLLARILQESLRNLWLDTIGRDVSSLSQQDGDKLTFVFGGLVSLLASIDGEVTPKRLVAIASSPLGRGIFETLAEIVSSRN